MDALLEAPLVRLLAETFDSALATSYRSFALALAAMLEARLTQGAELLLRPMLRAVARTLGGSWRQWAAVAAIGLLMRARRLTNRPLRPTTQYYSRSFTQLSPSLDRDEVRSPIVREMDSDHERRGGTTLTAPAVRADGAAAFPLPDGSGTWYFMPASAGTPQECGARGDGGDGVRWKIRQPLMLAGPATRSLAHRSRL